MDIGALSLNKSRLPSLPRQCSVTFCPEHEYFILSLPDSSVSTTWISDLLIKMPSTDSLFINCPNERGFMDESLKAEGT